MADQHTPLIATIAVGLMLAYVLGLAAHRLRFPAMGSLSGRMLVGPFTPGIRGGPGGRA